MSVEGYLVVCTNSFLLFLESSINIALDLVFNGILAASSDGLIFNVSLNTPTKIDLTCSWFRRSAADKDDS